LVARANAEKKVFEGKEGHAVVESHSVGKGGVIKSSLGQQSRRAYLQTLRKVIDSSDILLQVLDARDPIGTRVHPAIENTILSHYDKKMVLVLNKIDLIPKPAVSEWLNYLRKSRPTVAIKCGTNMGSKIGRAEVDCQGALASSCGVGVDELMGLLKNYSRSSTGKGKTCITVGIIGYPNVGKSSILNTLKRSRAVGVSPRPGFTTCLQEVVLDRNLRLIDSPGVVFDNAEEQGNSSETMLRNCIDADSVEDPIPAIQALLNRCSAESLMMTYSIPAFPKNDAMIFLAMIAKRNGKVLKGGIPDKVMAARTVLRDWNSGKIPYYTRPPTVDQTTSSSAVIEAGDVKIVSGFGEKFDVNKMDVAVLNSLDNSDAMDFVEMEPDNLATIDATAADTAVRFLTRSTTQSDGDDDDMEEDSEAGHGVADMEEEEVSKSTAAQSSIANAEDYDFSAM